MKKAQFESSAFRDSRGFEQAIKVIRQQIAEAFRIETKRFRLSPNTMVFQMFNEFSGQWVNYTDDRGTMAERIKHNDKEKFRIKTKELILK